MPRHFVDFDAASLPRVASSFSAGQLASIFDVVSLLMIFFHLMMMRFLSLAFRLFDARQA